jgi:hypothetical protein
MSLDFSSLQPGISLLDDSASNYFSARPKVNDGLLSEGIVQKKEETIMGKCEMEYGLETGYKLAQKLKVIPHGNCDFCEVSI